MTGASLDTPDRDVTGNTHTHTHRREYDCAIAIPKINKYDHFISVEGAGVACTSKSACYLTQIVTSPALAICVDLKLQKLQNLNDDLTLWHVNLCLEVIQ